MVLHNLKRFKPDCLIIRVQRFLMLDLGNFGFRQTRALLLVLAITCELICFLSVSPARRCFVPINDPAAGSSSASPIHISHYKVDAGDDRD